MKLKNHLIKQIFIVVFTLFAYSGQSQEASSFKYFTKDTIDKVKIDYDNDGDLDYIVAGVNSERFQGRIYLVENKGKSWLNQHIFIPIQRFL